jgi:hypothetical protein
MNSNVLSGIWRFVLLWAVQVLVLKAVAVTASPWLHAYIYPLFIFLLPITTPTPVAVLLAFALGMSIDIFYDSPGVHAGASVFTAWFRTILLGLMEPRTGYSGNQIPSKYYFGMQWFLQFSGVMMAVHLLIYFSLDAFSFVYFFQIIGKTITAFLLSMMFVLIFQQLFDPKS